MPWNLAVLMGGPSPERAISLQSGSAMAAALRDRGHLVTEFDLDLQTLEALRELRPDCVVLALHGVPGEDGSVQGMLDLLGLPYTGSGLIASAVAIDKILAKRVASATGLTVPRDCVVRSGDAPAAINAIGQAGLQWPLIVKGSTGGSTIGLTKVTDPSDLPLALESALAGSPAALIEECVSGTEISVCLLGNDDPQILPTPEIVSTNELFDFEAKYTPGLSHHVYPPRTDAGLLRHAEQQAKRLYQFIGCAGCGRVDMILTGETAYFLEINTLPGMTAVSILPDAASRVGLDFADVCERLVDLGIARGVSAHAFDSRQRIG